jgi:F-type H+-transporting ATPase subunit b
MLIDWFTVVAQAINFLILVWLMKHFLYKPILNAIDAREKKVAAELADAAAKKAEAKKDRDEFQHKNEEFDQQRAALFDKATAEAKTEGHRLLDEARKTADALSAKRQESLKNDAQNLNQAIARRTQQEVFAITRKALTELATTSLEERLGEVFTRRLYEMDAKAKASLGEALKKAAEPALVRSAFELPAEQRAKIQNALNETFSADVHLRFETVPDLVCGIEVTTNGQKVAWSIADYLTSLEKSVGELLKQQEKPESKAEPKSSVKAEPSPEAKAQAKPTPEDKPVAKNEPESKAMTKTEPADTAKSESNADNSNKDAANTKAQVKPKPEPASESTPPVAAKAEPKPEESKAAPVSS